MKFLLSRSLFLNSLFCFKLCIFIVNGIIYRGTFSYKYIWNIENILVFIFIKETATLCSVVLLCVFDMRLMLNL